MKWLLVCVIVFASVLGFQQGKAFYDQGVRDSFLRGYDQAKSVFQPEAPKEAEAITKAFCNGDAKYLSEHGAGQMSATEEQIQTLFGNTPPCIKRTYLGKVENGTVTQYIYILQRAGRDAKWWVFYLEDGYLVDLQ